MVVVVGGSSSNSSDGGGGGGGWAMQLRACLSKDGKPGKNTSPSPYMSPSMSPSPSPSPSIHLSVTRLSVCLFAYEVRRYL